MNESVLESIVAAESTESPAAAPETANEQADSNAGGADGVGLPDGGQVAAAASESVAAPAGDKQPAKAEPQKQDTVPHAALHEAREQVKQLRSKITELEALPRLTAEDAQLLRELKEARTAQQQKEAEPDFLADPKGYVDTKVQTALKKLEEAEKVAKETDQKVTQQQLVQAVQQTAAAHEAEFSKATPDFPQALTHVRTLRMNQLQGLYPQATQQQIAQQIAQEEIAIAHQVISQGQNVAEFAYKYAQSLGYKPPAAPPKQQQQPDKSAVRTMGSGGSDGAPDADASEDPNNEFLAAQGELMAAFKRKA